MDQDKLHELDKKVSVIEADIRTIKVNHLAHIEKDMASVLSKLDKQESRFYTLLTSVLGVLVASVGALLVMVIGFGN